MVRINNCQNTQEYNTSQTQQAQGNQKASIFLVDDGDNKFGLNDIQGGIKFDENIMTELLKEYIGKPFEKVKDSVLEKINQLINTQVQQKRFTKAELEKKVENVKLKLNETLKGKIFNGPAGPVGGEQILEIINKTKEDDGIDGIIYNYEGYGAGRGDSNTGQIIINLNGTYSSDSDAELMKLIIHEALHCVYKTNGADTWDEERCCESQAIEITAQIIESEKDNPNTTFTPYWMPNYQQDIMTLANDKNLLDATMQSWLEDGYANRPQNQSGDISILKNNTFNPETGHYTNTQNTIEIKSEDEIYIDGEKSTKIGWEHAILESSYLSNQGNSNVCRLIIHDRPSPGEIIFDGTEDSSGYSDRFNSEDYECKNIEIRRNGVVICTGKLYTPKTDNFNEC